MEAQFRVDGGILFSKWLECFIYYFTLDTGISLFNIIGEGFLLCRRQLGMEA